MFPQDNRAVQGDVRRDWSFGTKLTPGGGECNGAQLMHALTHAE